MKRQVFNCVCMCWFTNLKFQALFDDNVHRLHFYPGSTELMNSKVICEFRAWVRVYVWFMWEMILEWWSVWMVEMTLNLFCFVFSFSPRSLHQCWVVTSQQTTNTLSQALATRKQHFMKWFSELFIVVTTGAFHCWQPLQLPHPCSLNWKTSVCVFGDQCTVSTGNSAQAVHAIGLPSFPGGLLQQTLLLTSQAVLHNFIITLCEHWRWKNETGPCFISSFIEIQLQPHHDVADRNSASLKVLGLQCWFPVNGQLNFTLCAGRYVADRW